MPALKPNQIADLVTNTLHKFKKDAWVDISLDLQDYIVMSRLLQANKVAFDGGDQLQWQVQVAGTDAAENTGLYDEDTVAVEDVMKYAIVPWAFQKTYFAYDEREPVFQSTTERIVDVVKTRRHAALNSLTELMEQNFWGMPDDESTASEQLKPYGVPYWVVGYGAGTSFGLNGGMPCGSSSQYSTGAGGLSSTTYTNWANGNATYSVVSKTDLIRLMREAMVKSRYKAPNPYPEVPGPPRFACYTVYSVIQKLEEILEAQNDNLGNDIASKDGLVTFRRHPVIWVPYLDQNERTENGTTIADPIYGLDWAAFQCVFKSGEFMRETPPIQWGSSHRVKVVFIDTMQQFRCTDRRRCWVLFNA